MTFIDALCSPLELPATGTHGIPKTGECWVLSDSGEDCGVVVIVRVRQTHVIAWVVTSACPAASYPTFVVDLPIVGRVEVWPESEFGMSLSSLDRCLGQALVKEQVRNVVWSIEKLERSDAVSMRPPSDDPTSIEALSRVCMQAWALGDLSWPNAEIGSAVFDTQVLVNGSVTPKSLASTLSLPPNRASQLFQGQAVPNKEQVESVLALLPTSLAAEGVLRPQADGYTDLISLPEYKEKLNEVRAKKRLTESQARSTVWEKSLVLAARQSQAELPSAMRERVAFALDQLLED